MIIVKKDIVSPLKNEAKTIRSYFTIGTDAIQKPMSVEVIAQESEGPYVNISNTCTLKMINNDLSEEIIESKVIQEENFYKTFVIEFSHIDIPTTEFYIRGYNEDKSSISPKINVSLKQTLEFITTPQDKEFLPKKIKVIDNNQCFGSNSVGDQSLVIDELLFDIQIFVTNDANGQNPVWEDATESYLNKTFYTFTNTEKDGEHPWAISVKYVVSKKESENNLEISNISILVI